MRAILAVCILTIAPAHSEIFPSLDALTKAIASYDFSADSEMLGCDLAIEEPRQPEMPARIVSPTNIKAFAVLWKAEDRAIAYVTARPATESMTTETALLLAVQYSGAGWYVSSRVPFKARGKYADIKFDITGETGTHQSPMPIVTVTSSNGGRGASDRASATYELIENRFIRKDP